jgi:Protein of unknown function with PCYCGC motif
MRGEHKFWGLLLVAGMAITISFAVGNASQAATQSSTEEPVPAFHAQPAEGALPPTMDPALFDNVLVRNAYTVAGRVKKVLYQQPCYCHCDRSQGHTSLLDCFTSRHGSGCNLCMDEAFYAYEQTRKGKTPAQIRAGIEKGEWQKVNTSKYEKPLLGK